LLARKRAGDAAWTLDLADNEQLAKPVDMFGGKVPARALNGLLGRIFLNCVFVYAVFKELFCLPL